jgi:hypothetical protein
VQKLCQATFFSIPNELRLAAEHLGATPLEPSKYDAAGPKEWTGYREAAYSKPSDVTQRCM